MGKVACTYPAFIFREFVERVINKMKYLQEIINGRLCNIAENGTGNATFFLPLDPDTDGDWQEVPRLVCDILKDKPFRIIGFKAGDWDRELSPWEAEGVFKNQRFAGNGIETLKWLMSDEVSAFAGDEKYIVGYSLGGLFALWSYYESRRFKGVASCSGSLWYPGWKEYVAGKETVEDSKIYLSLGDREEKTRNPVMAAIGDITRKFCDIYKADNKLSDFHFEWNAGNHFADVHMRLAKGIAWLLL